MSWNYRIVKHLDGSGYGLHEIFYDDQGQPWGMDEQPRSFSVDLAEGPEGIIADLVLAAAAVKKHPVLVEPEHWPGEPPEAEAQPSEAAQTQEDSDGSDELLLKVWKALGGEALGYQWGGPGNIVERAEQLKAIVDANHDWCCGCGHWNGPNLSVCGMCKRTPQESLPAAQAASEGRATT